MAASARLFRRCARLAGTTLLILALGGAQARCELGSKKPTRRAQPARAAQSAPDRTGSIARTAMGPAVPKPATPEPADGVLTPIYLPSAPRSRMLACGEAWHVMKMNGTAGDDSWREFAFKCLAARDAPAR